MLPWWITLIAVVATVVGSFAAVLWLLGTMAARHINQQIEEPLALFVVGVDDPTDPVRRYYGPFVTNLDAEEYAAPLRLDGVHAWVAPLWRP